MTTVVFACVHNAGRSQMAAAFFNRWAHPDRARALSAGTQPGERVHPEVVTVMRERDLDLAEATPQRLTDALARQAQLLVTMGCGDRCPVVPGLERDDWPFDDPKGQPLERVREIRDAIEARVRALLASRGWAHAPELRFAPAAPHRDAVAALLSAAQLPHEDIDAHVGDFIVALDGQCVVGAAGLERLGTAGLVRSVVVAADARRHGLGAQLYARILARATELGLGELYLMTTTAEAFFARHGFVRIDRAAAPPALQATREWSELCPASAAVMRLQLPVPSPEK